MAAAPPLPKQLAVAVYNNRFHDTRTGLAGHSRVPNHPLRKDKGNVPSPRKKRKTRKAKAHPVPQHAARLARGPFVLPHGLPGAYSRVASSSISARPVA